MIKRGHDDFPHEFHFCHNDNDIWFSWTAAAMKNLPPWLVDPDYDGLSKPLWKFWIAVELDGGKENGDHQHNMVVNSQGYISFQLTLKYSKKFITLFKNFVQFFICSSLNLFVCNEWLQSKCYDWGNFLSGASGHDFLNFTLSYDFLASNSQFTMAHN